jgi:thioester reductase-like protein
VTDTVFLTGFPGFLGSRLLPRVLRRMPEARAACLVQPRFEAQAKDRVRLVEEGDADVAGRIELVAGDLTAPGLGLDEAERARLAARVSQVWHLAAVYDLSVARDVGMRVNVEGTRNVLRFASDCPGLERHHYVSTCYVSGRHCGPFREDDLDVGQRFNNYYEETKFLAEAEVAEARAGGMPTTVYRPAIVVGDSRTGDTQKFDGPYFLLQWLLRQPRWAAVVPYVGDPTMVRFNMVPSDFVLDAVEHLSGLEESSGRVYQLADPRPLTVDALLDEMGKATDRRPIRVRLPHRLTTWTLAHVGPIARYVGIPASAVEYFLHPTHYDTTAASRDLAGSGITCPAVPDYLPTLVRFVREHAEANVGVMV